MTPEPRNDWAQANPAIGPFLDVAAIETEARVKDDSQRQRLTAAFTTKIAWLFAHEGHDVARRYNEGDLDSAVCYDCASRLIGDSITGRFISVDAAPLPGVVGLSGQPETQQP